MLRHRTLNSQLSTLGFFGFTLLELLVVMAIMAMLTGMSVPAISGYIKGARLKGGAREIASALRLARTMAITKRAIYSVDFIEASNQFYVNDDSSAVDEIRTLPETITFYNYSSSSWWTIADSSDDTDSYLDAEFTPRGSYKGGNHSLWIVNVAGDTKEITIINATGRVRVQ